MSKTVFKASDISKSFPGVRALSSVDFDLREGEVHALVGENGAGKSTLVSIIAGLQSPDSGLMQLDEQAYQPGGKADAEAHGIRMVMQELHLIPNLSVAENIFIEKLPSRFGFVHYSLNFNLKRNIFIRSITPHGVSDSLNIFEVYYLAKPQLCQSLLR